MVCNLMNWQANRLHTDYPTSRRQPDEVKSIWSPNVNSMLHLAGKYMVMGAVGDQDWLTLLG